MLEQFIEKRFNTQSENLLELAAAILQDYSTRGFSITLRGLYYQMVARGHLQNNIAEYRRIGGLISDARVAGRLDWDYIQDNVRALMSIATWVDAQHRTADAAKDYAEDLWQTQERRVEVWVEKDAILGVVTPACNRYRVPYFAGRGYVSQTAQYEAGKRFADYEADGKAVVVLHLGDHDPSGIDMTRDNRERLSMFARYNVELIRIALNFDQVQQYNPPPNPAKLKDPRGTPYVQAHGLSSWELDALNPDVLDKLIADHVEKYIDAGPWEAAKKKERQQGELLKKIEAKWPDVLKFIKRKPKLSKNKKRSRTRKAK